MTPTVPDEIYKLLKVLKLKKSTGHDNVSTYLLKSIDEQVSTPVSILLNKSLETGIFPDSLKLAKVIPIYKAKARENSSN